MIKKESDNFSFFEKGGEPLSVCQKTKAVNSLNITCKEPSKLSKDSSRLVRVAVAQSDKTKKKVLLDLSRDEDLSVRYFVALNPNSPAEALKVLSRDSSKVIRELISLSPESPSRQAG